MGKSRFKLPQIMPLFSFSSSKEASIDVQQKHEHDHGKLATGRMIFGCQAFDSMSKNVRNPLPAQKSRVSCSPPANCKKLHACRSLSTTSMSKQSHLSSASMLEDAAELVSEDGVLTSENNGDSGTPIDHILHARRGSDRSKNSGDVKARKRLSFGCDTHIKPQMGGSSDDFEQMSAAMQSLDIKIDASEKVNAWNVLGSVKNKIVSKRVMLRKRKGYKRIHSPSLLLHDSLNTSKAKELKVGCFRRIDGAGSERRSGSSVCSYRLSTSSVDSSLDGEHCASDRDQLSSFASEHSFVQRSFQEEAALTLRNSPSAVELGAFREKDLSIYRASETNRLCETTAGENASVSFKPAFRVASKLPSEGHRKGIACQRIVRKRKRFVSESSKMLVPLINYKSDPALLKKGYSRHSNDLESSSKRWMKPPPSKIVQRMECNMDLSETRFSNSMVNPSREPNTAIDPEPCKAFNSGNGEIHDLVSVQATATPSPIRNHAAARSAAALQQQCRIKAYSKAPWQNIPSKDQKKVREGVAVIKSSYNPYQDFQTSMVEMILSKRIREPAHLNELLECYIGLNSSSYRDLIITAFEDAWQQIFSNASAHDQSITTPLHFPHDQLNGCPDQ